jgi:hypothetical protein
MLPPPAEKVPITDIAARVSSNKSFGGVVAYSTVLQRKDPHGGKKK